MRFSSIFLHLLVVGTYVRVSIGLGDESGARYRIAEIKDTGESSKTYKLGSENDGICDNLFQIPETQKLRKFTQTKLYY